MSVSDSSTALSSSLTNRAPKLLSGAGYAEWEPLARAFLTQLGIFKVCERECKSPSWKTIIKNVMEWEDESWTNAFSKAVKVEDASSSSSSSSSTSVKTKLEVDIATSVHEAEVLEARKKTQLFVTSSQRAYALVYEALTPDMRLQVSTAVDEGYAYGIWTWLREKFQSNATNR